jgi:hypothetical protein
MKPMQRYVIEEQSYFDSPVYRIESDVEEIKKHWWRVESRETERTRLTHKVGDAITFDTVIERAGYFYQPEDMPIKLLEERAENMLATKSCNNMKDWFSHENHPIITPEMIKRIHEASGIPREIFYRHIYYEVRKEWLAQMQATLNEDFRSLRTFWYYCLPKPQTYVITCIKACWIGQYYPPQSWAGGYESEPEYEPGGLTDALYQQVYVVNFADHEVYVHPLDVKENENA